LKLNGRRDRQLMRHSGRDWRWRLETDDSPWYPRVMRLFRQAQLGKWEYVISDIAAALMPWR
jgi:hypothetical protein